MKTFTGDPGGNFYVYLTWTYSSCNGGEYITALTINSGIDDNIYHWSPWIDYYTCGDGLWGSYSASLSASGNHVEWEPPGDGGGVWEPNMGTCGPQASDYVTTGGYIAVDYTYNGNNYEVRFGQNQNHNTNVCDDYDPSSYDELCFNHW